MTENGVQDTDLSSLFRKGDRIAFKTGDVVKFGTVTASPGAQGIGSIDVTPLRAATDDDARTR